MSDKKIFEILVKDSVAVELIKMMKPMDLLRFCFKDLGLQPKDACKTTLNLLKHTHDVHYNQNEGMPGYGIETNKDFPVSKPLVKKANKFEPEYEEPVIYREATSGPFFSPNDRVVVKRWHFPPDPQTRPDEWPYDDAQRMAMDPHNRGKRAFPQMVMAGKDTRTKNVKAHTDGGGGIHQMAAPHNKDGSMGDGGGLTTQGYAGWSKSPQGKEFDLPQDSGKEVPKIKKYVFQESLLREIPESEIDKISDVLNDIDRLSFDNIFGDKKRIAIPFESSAKEEIDEIIDFFERNGYTLDFSTGLAEREVEIPAGPKKGQKQKKKESIGSLLKKFNDLLLKYGSEKDNKALENLKKMFPTTAKNLFTDIAAMSSGRYLKFWNSKSEFYRKNPDFRKEQEDKYSIVITRHPIDVLRMSDFQDISSCHSKGGEYYKCAVAEAQGHGLVAYVVDTKDLKKVNLDDDEIFVDRQRGVKGIEPISRVRLRKYAHNKSGDELAVPELRIYGKSIPGLVDTVSKWAKEKQEIPSDIEMDDYSRYGGTYADSADGSMWNRFLDTNDFYGDVEQVEDPAEQQEEEGDLETRAEEIKDRWNNRLKHSSVDYDISDDGEGGTLTYFATLRVTFDEDKFETTNITYNYAEKLARDIEIGHDVPFDNVNIEERNGKMYFDFNFDTSEQEYTVEDFEGYCMYVKNVDDKYDVIRTEVRNWLVKEEYMKSSIFDKIIKDPKKIDKFVFDTKNGELEYHNIHNPFVFSLNKIDLRQYKGLRDYIKFGEFKDGMFNLFVELFKKTASKHKEADFKNINKEIFINIFETRDQIRSDINIKIKDDYPDELILTTLDFVEFLGKNIDNLNVYLQKLYNETINKFQNKQKTLMIKMKNDLIKVSQDKSYSDFVNSLYHNNVNVNIEYAVIGNNAIIIDEIDNKKLIDLNKYVEDYDEFIIDWFKAILLNIRDLLKIEDGGQLKKVYLVNTKEALFKNTNINSDLSNPLSLQKELFKIGFRKPTAQEEDEIEPYLINVKDYNEATISSVIVLDLNRLREQKIKRYRFETKDDLSQVNNLTKPSPVGSPIPSFNTGERVPNRRRGFQSRFSNK